MFGLIFNGWIKAFDFLGRSTRAEWWMFNVMAYFVLALVSLAFALISADLSSIVLAIGIFWLLLGSVSISVRRIRDIDASGWWALLLIPLWLPMIVVAFIPSAKNKEKSE